MKITKKGQKANMYVNLASKLYSTKEIWEVPLKISDNVKINAKGFVEFNYGTYDFFVHVVFF